MEQQEYKKEGIPWSSIDFIDNAPCIELISRKPIGFLALLDEESNFPKGTDQSLLTKLHQGLTDNKYYLKPKQNKPVFSIVHYAGEVQYNIEGFLDKNKDTLRQEIMDLFSTSKVEIIQQLFATSEIPSNYDSDKGITIKNATTRLRALKTDKKVNGAQKKATLGTQFNTSLGELMDTLGSCNPYFVRCVKPNQKKVSDRIDRKVVLDQLQYSGMLATVKVRKAGYPMRIPYTEFNRRYGMIITGFKSSKPKDGVESILKVVASDPKFNKNLYYLGASKIFMKQEVQNILERSRGDKFAVYAVRIQARWRGYKQRKEYLRDLFLVVRIQVKVRIFVRKIRFRARMKAALRIQRVYKGYKQRKMFKVLLKAHRDQLKAQQEIELQRMFLEEQAKLEELNKFAEMCPPDLLNMLPIPDMPDMAAPPPPMFFTTEEVVPSYKYDENAIALGIPKHLHKNGSGNNSGHNSGIITQLQKNNGSVHQSTDLDSFPTDGKPRPFDHLAVPHQRRDSIATTNLDDDEDDVKVAEVALPDAIQDILDDLNDIFGDSGAGERRRSSSVQDVINSNLKKFIPKASKDGQHINYQLPEAVRKKLLNTIRILGFGDLIPVIRVETHITGYRKQLVPDENALNKVAQVLFRDPEDIKYTVRKLSKSLIPMDEALNLTAVRINKTILKMTHENLEAKIYFHCLWYIAEEIRCSPELKDEIICQLWKQTNKCTNSDASKRTWVLLNLFLESYIPNATIKQGLLSFMLHTEDEMGRICLESLCRSKSEERKSPFAGIEWLAASKSQMIAIPVEAANDESFSVGLDGLANCKEVISAFGNYYGISGEDLQGYAIEIEIDGQIICVDSADMIMDIIAAIEKDKNGVNSKYYIGVSNGELEEDQSDLGSKSTFEQSVSGSVEDIKPLKSSK
eukprot:NODE_119_length_18895_cov_0.454990.p3 type:complete len:911 gc:universal NODE_119_length_18895_cov_0.454990:9769-12501(+)